MPFRSSVSIALPTLLLALLVHGAAPSQRDHLVAPSVAAAEASLARCVRRGAPAWGLESCGGTQGANLGVSRRIDGGNRLIEGGGDDFIAHCHHGANGHFVVRQGFPRLDERRVHQFCVRDGQCGQITMNAE